MRWGFKSGNLSLGSSPFSFFISSAKIWGSDQLKWIFGNLVEPIFWINLAFIRLKLKKTKYSFSNQHEYFWSKWQYFNWNYEAFIFLLAPTTKQSPQRSFVPYTQCALLWLILYFGCVRLDLVVFGPICSVVIMCVFFLWMLYVGCIWSQMLSDTSSVLLLWMCIVQPPLPHHLHPPTTAPNVSWNR